MLWPINRYMIQFQISKVQVCFTIKTFSYQLIDLKQPLKLNSEALQCHKRQVWSMATTKASTFCQIHRSQLQMRAPEVNYKKFKFKTKSRPPLDVDWVSHIKSHLLCMTTLETSHQISSQEWAQATSTPFWTTLIESTTNSNLTWWIGLTMKTYKTMWI